MHKNHLRFYTLIMSHQKENFFLKNPTYNCKTPEPLTSGGDWHGHCLIRESREGLPSWDTDSARVASP